MCYYNLKSLLKRGYKNGLRKCNLNNNFLIRDVSLNLMVILSTLRW